MSVELRARAVGKADCDWGEITYPDPRPDRGQVGHLILITQSIFSRLFKTGPQTHHGAVLSVAAIPDTDDDGQFDENSTLRLYAYIDHAGQRWTWELFDAHWADGLGPRVYIGRWPD